MEDKNIFPRLSRKMLESSSFFSCFVLLLLVVVLSLRLLDDVLMLLLIAAIVEKSSLCCKLTMELRELARSLRFIDGMMLVAEVATERDGCTILLFEVFMRLHIDCNVV